MTYGGACPERSRRNTLNRLTLLNSSLAVQFTFGYDELSRRTSLTRPNGVNTAYTYDSLSRLLSVLHQAGRVTIDGAAYTVDNSGNRTDRTNYLDNSAEQYAYDAIYHILTTYTISHRGPQQRSPACSRTSGAFARNEA